VNSVRYIDLFAGIGGFRYAMQNDIDLFAGIGGFRYAMQNAAAKSGLAAECVFSSEIDGECQRVYQANFGELPEGDITAIPDHDLLLAGFPW